MPAGTVAPQPPDSIAPLPDLIRRVLFTIGALLVYRIGCAIPVPGIDFDTIGGLKSQISIEVVSLFALGVTPILSALLIVEFFKLVIPPLSRWEAADPSHVRRLRWKVYLAGLLMAAFQGYGIASALYEIPGLLAGKAWAYYFIANCVAATALLGWLGDRITRQGIGTGFWLLLILPTLIKLPAAAALGYEGGRAGLVAVGALAAVAVYLAVATALIVAVAKASPATAADNRTGGADFNIIWPPLFATAISGFAVEFWFSAAGPAHLLLLALLIAGFTWLQRRGNAGPPAGRIVAAVQFAICAGAEILTQNLKLPFTLDGSWLIVVVVVAMNCLRRKDAAAT